MEARPNARATGDQLTVVYDVQLFASWSVLGIRALSIENFAFQLRRRSKKQLATNSTLSLSPTH